MKKLILLSLLIFGATSSKLYSQNNIPDSLFGDNSILSIDMGPGNEEGSNLLLQPDGKIIYGGYDYEIGLNAYFNDIVRFDECGLIDSSFGDSGIVHHTFEQRNIGYIYKLQDDGKILCGGIQSTSNAGSQQFPFIARYNSDGSIDSTFAGTGSNKFTFDGTSAGSVYSIETLADGRIVCMGTCNAGGAGIFRLFADGSPDTTFDSDGKAFYLFSNFSAFSEVYGHMLQNGKMILVTATWDGSFIDHFTAIAYDSTGSRDTLFGVNGFFTDTTSLDIYSNGLATALQQDEKIIIVANRPSLAGIEAVRINSDGTIDTTFGNGGHVSISTSQYLAKKVRVLLNGQILILGKSDLQDGFGIMLLPDGTIDSTFGTNGFMVLNMGQNGPAVDLLEMSSGDMLIAGTAFSAFRVVRYTDHSNVPHITDNGIQLSSTGTGTFQWFMNGNALAGEVNSTYSYTQNGTYTVQLTDQAGCTYLSDSVVITNTGIQGALNENYSVYPNPADQFIKLKNLKNSFEIIDPEGRIIFSRQNIEQIAPETIEINTSSIENGIYFLRNLGGSMTKTQRIIIHH